LVIFSRKISLAEHIRNMLPMFIVAIIAVFIDQLTKAIARKVVAPVGDIEVIKGFFELSYVENTGAAFGTFSGQNTIFIIIGFAAIILIFVYYKQFIDSTWMKISLGFLLGGALGNLLDRIIFHCVTDFIRVRWWLIHPRWWPNFNIADAAVLIGAIMLILGMIKKSKPEVSS
jgi:signal peptidase II